ncbi:MAG: MFS transporter [Chitinivibrionales bacterium]|nr:MFS transporter [Chitinivibrionales bacterium]
MNQSNYLKFLYFFLFIGLGGGLPFVGIYYKHVITNPDGSPALGIIGLIFFITPIVGFLANIGAALVADKFSAGRAIITICCFGAAFSALAIGFWPLFFGPNGEALFAYIPFIVAQLIVFACVAPINPIIDAETMCYLNVHNQRQRYGSYRIWGTVGWSVSTIALGIILYFHSDLSILFYATAVEFLILGIISYKGCRVSVPIHRITIPWHHLRQDRDFQFFLLFTFFYGVVANASFTYMAYFFDDVMKTPLEICLIYGTWTIFELPIMFYGHRLITTLGNRNLIVLGLLFNAVRLILISFFTKESAFIGKFAIALLQGPAFGLTHLGFIDYVDRQAHHNLRATYMSLMNVVRMSISSAFGGIVGGWVIKQWSGAFLMQISGLLFFLFIFFFLFGVKGESIPSTKAE